MDWVATMEEAQEDEQLQEKIINEESVSFRLNWPLC